MGKQLVNFITGGSESSAPFLLAHLALETGHHDIHVAEILLKVALNTINHIKSDIDNM
jgi:hypothetical protein